MTNNDSPEQRRKDLAMIHLAKKDLGLDDDMYRDILKQCCGVESSADLDQPNRRKLLAFFRGRGWGRKDYRQGRPKNMNVPDRSRMLRKIEALLADAKRPWGYADALAKRICKVDSLTFCEPAQLGKVISALMYDAKRNGRVA
ncbi:MAG TPA: regulatory protein GemA [Candidatus Rifleibacterium sp.]|nr:regulatory protein GemA [Candidatus Rifleibacterium sp.]HPT45064.1 regulatory protein GemA [Candidatus Rifleibacterium sp.]